MRIQTLWMAAVAVMALGSVAACSSEPGVAGSTQGVHAAPGSRGSDLGFGGSGQRGFVSAAPAASGAPSGSAR